jgi:hypothetical protein
VREKIQRAARRERVDKRRVERGKGRERKREKEV